MRQGRWQVAAYTKQFRDLACHLGWLEDILVSCFKNGVNYDLYTTCIVERAPICLHDLCMLAKEVEINQAQNLDQQRMEEVTSGERLLKPKSSQCIPPPTSNAAKRDTEQQSAELTAQPRKGTRCWEENP